MVVRGLFMPEAWLSVWAKADGSNFKGQEPDKLHVDAEQLWASQPLEEVFILAPVI